MVKASDTKTSAKAASKQAAQPFFSNERGNSFFETSSPHNTSSSPFFVQAKLKIGEPDDHYEREADHVANQVLQRFGKESAQSPLLKTAPAINHIQPKTDHSEQEEKLQKKEEEPKEELKDSKLQKKPIFESDAENPDPPIQKKPTDGDSGDTSTSIESNLNSSKGSGTPLPPTTSDQMGSAIGADFSSVRIHNDSNAARMSEDLNAQAFTHGNDIYFNSGKYDPNSNKGKHLLAHELTHTIQQGGSIKRKIQPLPQETIQKVPATHAAPEPVSSEVVDISGGQFLPSEKVKAEIVNAGANGLDVRVIVPGISGEGKIKIKKDQQDNFDAVKGQIGYMPVLNEWAKQIGGLYLRFTVTNNAITGGFVSPIQTGGNPNEFIKEIKENAGLLGGAGLHVGKIPNIDNVFSGKNYKLAFNDLSVEVGGFIDAKFSLSLENTAKPIISATADVNVKGIAKGQLKLDNSKDKLTGEVSLAIDYKNFAGSATVKYNEDGSIDIHGKAAYTGDKLTGEIDFVSTDLESANNFAADAIQAAGGKKNVQNAGAPAAPPIPKEGKKERALAATGQLQFNLTKWFAGTVNVIVDGKGHITVIGKIAPPAEIELFKQKDFDKELISLQVEAGYGIPVIGTIGLFAGVSLSAVAYIGPAKIYNIEILGTYSTDPTIQKNIQIAASINISAYAGLRLRAEGGAKLTVLAHDLKMGVGVNADVGVKAYADARPTIGYRDPGEFFISGTAEMVAQPMLGLSGDFFIEVDAPWWSPISDEKWVWPIGSKEWPLSDPIGLSATMKEYVLGSGKAPEIEFKKPEFDASKFMTKMVDKQLPEKSAGAKEGGGSFKEDASVPKPDVADPKAAKAGAGADPKTGKGAPGLKDEPKKTPPDPKAQQEAALLFKDGAKKLEGIKGPLKKADLTKELSGIENSVKGLKYNVKLEGDKWIVTASAKGVDNPKPYKVAAIVTEEDKKAEGKEGKTDNHLEDFTYVKANVTMDQATHSIIVEYKGGVMKVVMRSDEVDLKIAAMKAKNEMLAKLSTEKNKENKKDCELVISTLSNIITEINDLPHTILLKLGSTKSPGKDTQQLEKELTAIEISKIESNLKQIGRISGADSLQELVNKKIPTKRWLPIKGTPGSYIRGLFYEGMFGSEWNAIQNFIKERDWIKPDIPKRIKAAQTTNDLTEWAALIRDELVDFDADNISTYDYRKVGYAVDHKDPVAALWNKSGNKLNDESRKSHFLNENNLRYITKRNNSKKGSGNENFDKYVYPGFESSIAEAGNPEAKTVKGDHFLDNDGGSPI